MKCLSLSLSLVLILSLFLAACSTSKLPEETLETADMPLQYNSRLLEAKWSTYGDSFALGQLVPVSQGKFTYQPANFANWQAAECSGNCSVIVNTAGGTLLTGEYRYDRETNPPYPGLHFMKVEGDEISLFTSNKDVTFFPGYPNYPMTRAMIGVSAAGGVLLYRGDIGAANFIRFDAEGNYTVLKRYPAYAFARGWENIINLPGDLVLFYNNRYCPPYYSYAGCQSYTGQSAVGKFDENGNFTQLSSFSRTNIGNSWTHIVNTGNGVFFYKGSNGSAQFGQFDARGKFTLLKTYVPYAFSPGWIQIANTLDGVLFVGGQAVLGSFDESGTFTQRAASVPGNQINPYDPIVDLGHLPTDFIPFGKP